MNYMMIHDISPLLTLIKKCSLYVCSKCYFFKKKKRHFKANTFLKPKPRAAILVKNLETLECVSPSPMLIWVLQSSHCFKIRLAQHCGRRGANVSENEGVRSECKKFGENSRQMAPVSTICDEYCI